MSKITVIGAGEVGASCAASLAERDFVQEIVLLDAVPGLAEGKALDLRQSAALKRFDTAVRGVTADYAAAADSDVVVVAAGAFRRPGMERRELLSTNWAIVDEVCRRVADCAPRAVIVMVSNPLDELCCCALASSGFPSHRVVGMSGMLDVARYKSFIAEALHVSTKDIQALILGGHGKTMIPLPRYTTIGGIPIRHLLSEDKVQEAIQRTRMGGEEIIGCLGRSGWYAAGAAVCEMVESIVCDQRRVFPASACLRGEYGYSGIFLGVPVVLGRRGVERVIEIELDPDDRDRFAASQREVRKALTEWGVKVFFRS